MSGDVVERAKSVLGPDVTPAPWVVNTEGWATISHESDSVIHGYYEASCYECGAEDSGPASVSVSVEDAEFIAAARSLVPELIAEVERLRPFSRCPRCSSMRTHSMDHWEEPIIVCDECGHGT